VTSPPPFFEKIKMKCGSDLSRTPPNNVRLPNLFNLTGRSPITMCIVVGDFYLGD
jgi:hypothetical protein